MPRVQQNRTAPVAFLLALALPATALAAPLTLREVMESVRDRYPPQAAADLERALADADLLTAEGGFDLAARARAGHEAAFSPYPSTTADLSLEQPTTLWGTTLRGGWRLGTGEIAPYYGERKTNEFGEARLGLTVPLWRNGPTDRRRANVWRAELQREVATATIRQALLENARSAALRYFEWIAAGQRVVVARELLQVAEARDGQLAERAARGDLPPIERTDNRRAIEQRRNQLATAKQGFISASLELSLFLRDPAGAPLVPGDAQLAELPPPAEVATTPLEQAYAKRPELQRLGAQRKQTRVEQEWAQNQQAPGLDLGVDFSQDLGTTDPKLAKPNLQAGLSVELPVQVRVAKGREDAATASLARLDQLERFARDRVEVEWRDAQAALGLAVERVDAARRELDLARELERAERTKLDLGNSTMLFVNIREQATFETALRELDARLAWQRARVLFDTARGVVPALEE